MDGTFAYNSKKEFWISPNGVAHCNIADQVGLSFQPIIGGIKFT